MNISNPDVHKVTDAWKQAAQHSHAPACARTRAMSPTPASHSHHLAVSKTFKTLSLVGGDTINKSLGVGCGTCVGGGGAAACIKIRQYYSPLPTPLKRRTATRHQLFQYCSFGCTRVLWRPFTFPLLFLTDFRVVKVLGQEIRLSVQLLSLYQTIYSR